MTGTSQTVAVLGASDKPDRFSYQALQLLRQHGHTTIPIHPALNEIDGVPVTASIDQLARAVDTLTVYVNATVSAGLADKIVALKPGRVIFNPGAESPELAQALDANGIPHQNACTLILLDTGQFV